MKKELRLKNIFKLSWPIMFSQSIFVLVGIIDLLFISKFGTFAVGAVSIANFVCAGLYNFLEGLRSSTTVLTANFFGAKDKKNIPAILNISLLYALFTSIIILLLAWPTSNLIYSIISNEEIKKIGMSYLPIRLLAAPLILIFFILDGFFRGLKNTKIPFMITITVLSFNVILNYFFIYNQKMEIKGSAIATVFAYLIGTTLIIILLFKSKTTKQYLYFKSYFKKISPKLTKSFFKTALDISLFSGSSIFALAIFGYIYARISPTTLAAHQITYQIFMLVYMPAIGFFVAASIIVGKLLGAKELNLVNYAVKKIILICFSFISFFSLLIFIFNSQLSYFFSPTDPVVAEIVSQSLKIVCLILLLNPLFLVLKGALMGAKDTRFILIASLITAYLFFLPLVYLLGIKLNYGVVGGYIAYLIWGIIDTSVLYFRFFINKGWIKKISPDSKNS